MIITGYQGIGKSTLASKDDKIIDLESSSFWKIEDGKRTRHDDWYIYYCQVAEHLSRQGYTVFVSCHQEVRDYLATHSTERFCAIFPSKDIREDWLQRLKERYEISKSDKDLRAYEHAKFCYNNDVSRMWYECNYNVEYYCDAFLIKDINYDLGEIVKDIQDKYEKVRLEESK